MLSYSYHLIKIMDFGLFPNTVLRLSKNI